MEKLAEICTPHGANRPETMGKVAAGPRATRSFAIEARHGSVGSGAAEAGGWSPRHSSTSWPVARVRNLAFERQEAVARQPTGERVRPCVVGGRRKAKIAETLREIGQELRRGRNGGRRVEGVGEPALGGGARHELRDPLRARRTDGAPLEGALPPYEPGEEIDRQPFLPGRGLDDPAKRGQRIVGGGRGRIRERRRRRRSRDCGDDKGAGAPLRPRPNSGSRAVGQSRDPARPSCAAALAAGRSASRFKVFQPDKARLLGNDAVMTPPRLKQN